MKTQMDIYELAITKATPEEAARLLRDMTDETAQIRQQLEWLWANCKIVAWPDGGEYPLEHNLAANKDMRVAIEAVMSPNAEVSDPVVRCACGYDLRASGHCGTCGKYFSQCLGCHLPTRLSRCLCKVKTRHPDHPEEWR